MSVCMLKRAVSAARVASLVKGNDWHRKNGGKHVSAAPVSFEKSSHPSRDTQRSSWGRCNHTATSHSLSFSDLRRGTSASPLPSRTSRRRSQALKGHARGTRGRHMEGMSLAALGQAQSGDVPSGQARHAHIRASLIGGARPAMGSVPTPVPSLAVGLVPRPAPASVAVPSPVLAPAVAAPLPQPGSLLSTLMRARATSAADRLGEVAPGAAVSSRRQPMVMPFFAPLITEPALLGWWAKKKST